MLPKPEFDGLECGPNQGNGQRRPKAAITKLGGGKCISAV